MNKRQTKSLLSSAVGASSGHLSFQNTVEMLAFQGSYHYCWRGYKLAFLFRAIICGLFLVINPSASSQETNDASKCVRQYYSSLNTCVRNEIFYQSNQQCYYGDLPGYFKDKCAINIDLDDEALVRKLGEIIKPMAENWLSNNVLERSADCLSSGGNIEKMDGVQAGLSMYVRMIINSCDSPVYMFLTDGYNCKPRSHKGYGCTIRLEAASEPGNYFKYTLTHYFWHPDYPKTQEENSYSFFSCPTNSFPYVYEANYIVRKEVVVECIKLSSIEAVPEYFKEDIKYTESLHNKEFVYPNY